MVPEIRLMLEVERRFKPQQEEDRMREDAPKAIETAHCSKRAPLLKGILHRIRQPQSCEDSGGRRARAAF